MYANVYVHWVHWVHWTDCSDCSAECIDCTDCTYCTECTACTDPKSQIIIIIVIIQGTRCSCTSPPWTWCPLPGRSTCWPSVWRGLEAARRPQLSPRASVRSGVYEINIYICKHEWLNIRTVNARINERSNNVAMHEWVLQQSIKPEYPCNEWMNIVTVHGWVL